MTETEASYISIVVYLNMYNLPILILCFSSYFFTQLHYFIMCTFYALCYIYFLYFIHI